ISGGEASNQMPESASAEFYLTSHQFEDFKRFFRDITQKLAVADSFRIELGGLGDTGIGFLPNNLFECLCELWESMRSITEMLGGTRSDDYEQPATTVNVSALTQLPNLTNLFFDVRMLPGMKMAELRQMVNQGVAKVAARYPALNLSVELESSSP